MADLAEIMAAKGEPAPDAPMNEQTTQEPAQTPVQGQEPVLGTEPPQDEADPVSGLRKALDEERGKRRKYRDELAEVRQQYARMEGILAAFQTQQRQPAAPQPEPQPTDIFENPNGFIDGRVKSALDQSVNPMREALMFNARLIATQIHKPETVQEACTAFDQAVAARQIDPVDAQRIMSSPNPFHEAVQWRQRTAALTEIGTDPAAYRDRIKAEILAELQQGQAPGQPPSGAAQAPSMPTSFASARNAGPRATPQWSGPKPLSELMPR